MPSEIYHDFTSVKTLFALGINQGANAVFRREKEHFIFTRDVNYRELCEPLIFSSEIPVVIYKNLMT